MLPSPDLNARNKSAWEALYASTSDSIWGREPVGFLTSFLPDAASLPPGEVLDAAAGEGRNLPLLLALGRPVVACDASASALAKIPPELARAVRTLTCDLAQVPLPDSSCAFILASDLIETLPDPEPILRELARLLAPGGLLLANIPDSDDGVAGIDMQPAGPGWMYQEKYYFRFYEPTEAAHLLTRAGLSKVRDEVCEWIEYPHPHFRATAHTHRSHVLLAGRGMA
jgi:SAM-dependent methyltransferase